MMFKKREGEVGIGYQAQGRAWYLEQRIKTKPKILLLKHCLRRFVRDTLVSRKEV